MGASLDDIETEVVSKVEVILADVKRLKRDDFSARLGLLRQVDDLYQRLEPPINLFFRQWTSITVFTCIEIVIRAGVFEKLRERDDLSAEELGKATGVDAGVIETVSKARAMRILVAARIIQSRGEDRYSHTPKSLIFVPGEQTAIDSFNLLTLLNKCYITIPSYITTRPTSDLLDPLKSPYACAYGMEGKTFYETISAIPGQLDTFNRSMNQPGPDYGIFPYHTLKADVEAEPHRAFVVDIGGGNGKALRVVMKATSNAFGTGAQLVLQDRPDVLSQLNAEERKGLELMPHDFHTEQPVKNAHVYTLCQILHNYPDHLCLDILKNIGEAMGPKSRLLILDAVLPAQTEVGGDMMQYLIDFVGLAMSGKERTEKEVAILLESQGLQLVKVWYGKANGMGWQAVVEARLRLD
ncbi:Nn.00g029270.m01.CDS01 [Neocucurbitaria sp. VM-36]